MEKLFRTLGMVDKDGNVFDETKIREQVMGALGVSTPKIETVPVPKPPFQTYDDCYEACLALPTPDDPDFEQGTVAMRALAVAAIFEMEYANGGVQQYLWNCGSAYAFKTADSLREIGLPEHAAEFGNYLTEYQFDPASLDSLQSADDSDQDASEERFIEFCRRYPSERLDKAVDCTSLQCAIIDYANKHPEAFDFNE